MGRPNRTIAIAEELHAALTQAGHNTIPRDRFDSVIQKHYRIGGQQAYRVACDGEALGLWKRHRSLKAGAGWIELLATNQTPNPPQPEAHPLTGSTTAAT